jgi:pilus assembly protein FimV
VYAARKDAAAFGKVAQSLQGLTGGSGANWERVVALGYAIDPRNALYASGRGAAPLVDTSTEHTGTNLDFDLGAEGTNAPDIQLDADIADAATEVGVTRRAAESTDTAGLFVASAADTTDVPSFNLDSTTSSTTQTDIALEAFSTGQTSAIDFNIDLPALDAPTLASSPTLSSTPPPADSGMDFKIDVGDLNISLDEPPTAAKPVPGKDSHWYDVQQKFDLAKAYQEMGDNEGAREILQEVLKEGDDEQKDQANNLLGSLA